MVTEIIAAAKPSVQPDPVSELLERQLLDFERNKLPQSNGQPLAASYHVKTILTLDRAGLSCLSSTRSTLLLLHRANLGVAL
jgi:hypothetical protein